MSRNVERVAVVVAALALAIVLAVAPACAQDDPAPTGGTGGSGGTGGTGGSGASGGSGGAGGSCDPSVEDVAGCAPGAADYRPRDPEANQAAADPWPACISDDGTYHRVEQSVSSIARVQAFEQIALLLWDREGDPAPGDFTAARDVLEQPEGLGSRLDRRVDPHFDAPGGDCRDATFAAANADYCVGPAKLRPILNAAFVAGHDGVEPRVQAQRIHAALSWFLVVSTYKEAQTCFETPKDCDSSWAYYAGGEERGSPRSIGRVVAELGPETHDRIYDAILAMRCWRNLEGETRVDPAAYRYLDLQDAANAQLDRALDRGAALVARRRLAELGCGPAQDREGTHAFLQVYLPFLDRAARARDPAGAGVLAAAASAADADAMDASAAIAALDSLFPCP